MAKEANIYPNSVDTRVALLEQAISMINQNLTRMDADIREGFKQNREDLRDFKKDVKFDFRWVIGLMIAFGSGVLGVMAHGFHWI